MQRSRDLIAGELTLDYFMRKAAEGWRLVAVEWVRDAGEGVREKESLQISVEPQEIPYGLEISEDGQRLEQNPLEVTVLTLILEKIVREKRITEIANELNLGGFKTRDGRPWSPSMVFDLLPRLIEVGPKLLKTPDWPERRAPRSAPN